LLVVMINCFHFVWYPQSNEILLNLGMKMPSFSISCTRFEIVWYPQSNEILLNLGMKMPSFSISWTRFETNYSTCCTRKSSENICSNEILLKSGYENAKFQHFMHKV
jgi:hypothetical protein